MHEQTATAIAQYMTHRGYRLSENPGEKNLVYMEGMNPDFSLNADRPDEWNDLRLVLEKQNGVWCIAARMVATCEPGISEVDRQIKKLGGVARLQLTQYREACKMGFHKGRQDHPALVQYGEILVFRDANRDNKRTGDPISPAYGINHHSTRPGFKGKKVGGFSKGCCVAWNFEAHLQFIELMKTDPRYVANPEFCWDFTLIGADDFVKFQKTQTT